MTNGAGVGTPPQIDDIAAPCRSQTRTVSSRGRIAQHDHGRAAAGAVARPPEHGPPVFRLPQCCRAAAGSADAFSANAETFIWASPGLAARGPPGRHACKDRSDNRGAAALTDGQIWALLGFLAIALASLWALWFGGLACRCRGSSVVAAAGAILSWWLLAALPSTARTSLAQAYESRLDISSACTAEASPHAEYWSSARF